MAETISKHCPRCGTDKPLTLEFWRRRSGDKNHLWRPYCFRCDRPPLKGPQPSLIVDGQKRCRDCGQWLPATAEMFGRHITGGIEYLRSYCKPCQTLRHARYVKNNRSKVRSQAKKSYDKHRENRIAKEAERDRRLRADPILGPIRRAQYNAMGAKRRKDPAYREKVRAWDRAYATTDKGSARYNRRRALKENAPGHYTRSDVMRIAALHGFRCFWCNCDISERVTADHFIPLSKGGSNFPSNIVAACGSCNSIKHNKMPEEFRQYLKLLDATKSRL